MRQAEVRWPGSRETAMDKSPQTVTGMKKPNIDMVWASLSVEKLLDPH